MILTFIKFAECRERQSHKVQSKTKKQKNNNNNKKQFHRDVLKLREEIINNY